MMTYQTLIVEKKDGILRITLNRPEARNAVNNEMIGDLTAVFTKEAPIPDVRVVVLGGAGEAFCAGGDIKWMKESAGYTRDQNYKDAEKFSLMLERINHCPHPVIAKVHGSVMGGGLGIVSVCDYVLAAVETIFSFSEVRLGLIPATIGPYVLAKIGESHARALFLSAERFNAAKALGIGLVHQVVGGENLDSALKKVVEGLLQSSPHALKTAKKFLRDLKTKSPAEGQTFAAQTLADLRATPEAQEGLAAFLEKRKPNWVK
ncbi:MAG: enoyl-CoA hydratase/isomerase family protein [Deltaproteobacteria bacterium]|nr:enoyl-CoA hydratase/isomerase family protein [Deltaproteobacteria bacterium]